ncbi:MAG: helix-turn-helix domain-containing protein, partial [Coprothermobacterota bacterium]|nr:helix-turn-helix domain-containing protein [Coprothermobacterota bacterium]
MLKMVILEEIRKRYFLCGWSMRRIARELGISRPSVNKALQSAEMPCYRLPDRKPSPVLNP